MGISSYRIKASMMFDDTYTDASQSNIEASMNVHDWQTRVAIFFGLPLDPYKAPLNEKNFIRRMTDWHRSNAPQWQKILNWILIKPILTVALRIIAIPFLLAKNLLKLVTVFIPLLLVEYLEKPRSKLSAIFNNPNVTLIGKIFSGIGLIIVIGLMVPLYVVGNIAKLLTQPVKYVSTLWKGNHYYLAFAAGIFAAVSYMVLAPIAIYFLGPFILTQLATILPASIMHIINVASAFVNSIGNAIAPVCHFLGTYAIGQLTSMLGISAIQSGLGQLIGLAAIIIGSTVTVVGEKLSHWYHTQREGKETEKVVIVTETKTDHSTHKLNKFFNGFFHKIDKEVNKTFSASKPEKKKANSSADSHSIFKKKKPEKTEPQQQYHKAPGKG